jgi:hypothetical protein
MQFAYPIEVEPNVDKANPTRVDTPLCVGHLVKVSIYFPWGCAGWVKLRILHYEYQLYPTNRAAWFSGNEILIEFACSFAITQGWNEFKVEVYNEDNFYAHTPIVSFNVLPWGVAPTDLGLWLEG